MSYAVRVEADTVFNDRRITTLVCTYPRIIHPEILTHRAFCRNSSSSRAIPAKRLIEQVENNPFEPLSWGLNQRGMVMQDAQADQASCLIEWHAARQAALRAARELSSRFNVHKSVVNRLLEPFSWITVIITATEWANFFRLRIHRDADPHIRKIAEMMLARIENSIPVEIPLHLPFLTDSEKKTSLRIYLREGIHAKAISRWAYISAARSARVSYLTHDGKLDVDRDVELAERLLEGSGFGHWSPFEHFSVACCDRITNSPYRYWKPFRAFQSNEHLPGHAREYRNA